jgi:hypothetical protein
MIILLATGSHLYTHAYPAESTSYDLRPMAYERAFRKSRFPAATYIFTDLDRLGYWELELAAHLYAALRDAGFRVLNDPARFVQRFALLRRLKDQGVNTYDVWRVEDGIDPTHFPVFLRTQSGHRGPLSDLLDDLAAVKAEVERLLASGIPLRELMIAEFRAEPAEGDIYRKLSVYRVGETMVPALAAHEPHWAPKLGKIGAASQRLYDEELEIVRTNRFAGVARPVFELAHVDYGRVDFGLIAGRPEIYEINTNPKFEAPMAEHPFAVRLESQALVVRAYHEAMAAIDDIGGGRKVKLDDPLLAKQRRYSLKSFGVVWRAV